MSVLFVCISHSLGEAKKLGNKISVKQCAESAWKLKQSRVNQITKVVAVSKGKVYGVFAIADGKTPQKILTGSNKGRYFLPLKKASKLDFEKYSSPQFEDYRKMNGSIRYFEE